jgi:hypothetical protein
LYGVEWLEIQRGTQAVFCGDALRRRDQKKSAGTAQRLTTYLPGISCTRNVASRISGIGLFNSARQILESPFSVD